MASTREAARPLFTISSAKWLEYAPFRKHVLPELVYANPDLSDEATDAVFVRRARQSSALVRTAPSEAAPGSKSSDEDVMFRRRLYRLEWPGMHPHGDDSLPCELLQHWGGAALGITIREMLATRIGGSDSRLPLSNVIELRARDNLLHELPEAVAYHAAVGLGQDVPAGNLPGAAVQSVVGARFALDSKYHAAAVYLKWLAESHDDHPLLTGAAFDSAVRSRLRSVSIEATRLYFYMLGDQLYDAEARFYARGPLSDWWSSLATYLFWIGRTGSGVYESFAGWPEEGGVGWEKFAKELPDVAERMKFYQERGHDEARRLSHVGPVNGSSNVDGNALLRDIVLGIEALLNEKLVERAGDGMSAREIVESLYADAPSSSATRHVALRDAIETITRCLMGRRPDSIRLAKFLVKHHGRVVDARRLVRRMGSGSCGLRWSIRSVAPSTNE
jgi:hypothetical protein